MSHSDHRDADDAQPPTRRFAFRFDVSHRAAAVWFGIVPGTAEACVGPRDLTVRFGPWHVRTALENVEEIELTGPYAWWRTAGPARLAVTDRGLTFATNGTRGVRVGFLHPIAGIEPTGFLRHPELTVTVTDVDGFAACLRERVAGRRRAWSGW